MASITKRNDKWQARISYMEHGQRKTRNKSGFTTKLEAKKWVDNVIAQSVNSGTPGLSQITLYNYFCQWYETYEKPRIAPKTQTLYEYAKNIIKTNFGDTKLVNLTRSQFQEFLNNFGETHSHETCTKIASYIRASVRSAMDDGILQRNFTAHTIITGNDGKDKSLKFLDAAGMWELINRCEQTPDIKHLSQMMILTALFTGFRLAEVAGLQWQNLDLINRTLSVNNTYDWTTGGFKPTKNVQSKRTVTVEQELIDVLKQYRSTQADIDNPNNQIFLGERGVVPGSNGVNHVLRELSAELDLHPVLTFHGLRHTHASYLLAQDVSIYVISERLGHKDYTTTLNVYSHVQRELRTREQGKIRDAFNRDSLRAHDVHKDNITVLKR